MSIISGNAKLAGVIGWPVGHSLSPRVHGYWLDRYGLDGAYLPLPVKPEGLCRSPQRPCRSLVLPEPT